MHSDEPKLLIFSEQSLVTASGQTQVEVSARTTLCFNIFQISSVLNICRSTSFKANQIDLDLC